MQDMTRSDIEHFIRESLQENLVRRYMLQAPDIDQLVVETVEKAQGMFLWAVLVIEGLLKGMKSYHTVQDLRRRLQQLPLDLSGLYHQLLAEVDPIYHDEVSNCLAFLTYLPADYPPQGVTVAHLACAADASLSLTAFPLGGSMTERKRIMERLSWVIKGIEENAGVSIYLVYALELVCVVLHHTVLCQFILGTSFLSLEP